MEKDITKLIHKNSGAKQKNRPMGSSSNKKINARLLNRYMVYQVYPQESTIQRGGFLQVLGLNLAL